MEVTDKGIRELFEVGQREGRREVMEWILHNHKRFDEAEKDDYEYCFGKIDWQNKLREWADKS